MKPGEAACENSPPDSENDAGLASYTAFGDARLVARAALEQLHPDRTRHALADGVYARVEIRPQRLPPQAHLPQVRPLGVELRV